MQFGLQNCSDQDSGQDISGLYLHHGLLTHQPKCQTGSDAAIYLRSSQSRWYSAVLRLLLHTFYRIWQLWQTTGDVVCYSTTLKRRRRILIWEDIDYLLNLVSDNPDYFLDELLNLLKTNWFISVHYTTIHWWYACNVYMVINQHTHHKTTWSERAR